MQLSLLGAAAGNKAGPPVGFRIPRSGALLHRAIVVCRRAAPGYSQKLFARSVDGTPNNPTMRALARGKSEEIRFLASGNSAVVHVHAGRRFQRILRGVENNEQLAVVV